MPDNKQVATKDDNAVLSADDIALMEQAQGDVESFTINQVIVPRLIIVHGMSDYVKRGTAKFVDAARVGDIMDTLLLQPKSEVYFIPAIFEEHATEWKPNRGGIVRQYFSDHSKYEASAKRSADEFYGMPRKTSEGNDINLVPTYTGLLVNPETGSGRPVVLGFASTQAKKSRQMNGLIDALTFKDADGNDKPAPIYAQVFKLTTVAENYTVTKDGQTQQVTSPGWKIESAGLTLKLRNGRALWAQAQEIRKQVKEGVMRGVAPERETTGEATFDGPTPNRGGNEPPPHSSDDEIPF